MSLSGARGLVLISRNPSCETQAAMVADRVHELRFYESVTGETFPGEYGERISARRRGAKFESNLTQNNAALLRQAVAPIYGLDPDTMVVRNFDDEVPGQMVNAARLSRVRTIFKDLASNKPVPELLIQPRLRLSIGPQPTDFIHISPDFMVFDPVAQMYVPGEEKSFIVRDGVGDPGDLDPTRRQAGVQILALRHEAGRVGLADRVTNRAVFVFSTPQGLAPYAPFQEVLDAPVREITRAIQVLNTTAQRLKGLREPDNAPLAMLLDDLKFNFQESCVGSCVLAGVCKKRSANRALLLGDAVSDLLGPEAELSRIIELIDGARPRNAYEARLAEKLVDAAEHIGLRRRVA